MAYVAMNAVEKIMIILITFLNGVCRHELYLGFAQGLAFFLNGVCRHEQVDYSFGVGLKFLNGVCRHERFL